MQLTEAEIRGLCLKSREIFLSQPILLELEAPLKICGESWQRRAIDHFSRVGVQETSTASTMTSCGCLSTEAFLQSPTTCSWGTTWTEANSHLKQFVFC